MFVGQWGVDHDEKVEIALGPVEPTHRQRAVQVHADHATEQTESLDDLIGRLLDVSIDIGPLLRPTRRMINQIARWEARSISPRIDLAELAENSHA